MSDWDRLEGMARASSKTDAEGGRAGGLGGFTETPDWWAAGGVCAQIKGMLVRMTALERASLFGDSEVRKLVMDAVDSEKVAWAKRDAEEIPKILESKGKFPRRKTVKPYWMRTIERVDMEKRGSERLVGDWVMEPASECDEGEYVVVGLRFPEKRYALCQVKKGVTAHLFVSARPDIEIEGLLALEETPDFGTFLELVAGVGLPGTEKG